MHQSRRRRATSADVARVVGGHVKPVTLMMIKPGRAWLMIRDEPFCEVDFHHDGAVLALRFSCHCEPGYAAAVTSYVYPLASEVVVSTVPFLQTNEGRVLYGADAVAYWRAVKLAKPLLHGLFRAQYLH